jgi:hypothetical protein
MGDFRGYFGRRLALAYGVLLAQRFGPYPLALALAGAVFLGF